MAGGLFSDNDHPAAVIQRQFEQGSGTVACLGTQFHDTSLILSDYKTLYSISSPGVNWARPPLLAKMEAATPGGPLTG